MQNIILLMGDIKIPHSEKITFMGKMTINSLEIVWLYAGVKAFEKDLKELEVVWYFMASYPYFFSQ